MDARDYRSTFLSIIEFLPLASAHINMFPCRSLDQTNNIDRSANVDVNTQHNDEFLHYELRIAKKNN